MHTVAPTDPQITVSGDLPDEALESLARLLLDYADRRLAAEDDEKGGATDTT